MKKIIKVPIIICILLCFSSQVFGLTYKYDDLNRLMEVTYDSGKKTSYTYDAGGNILSVTNTGSDVSTVSSIAADASTLSFGIGATHNIIITATYSDDRTSILNSGVTFSSSKQSIATVSASGVITAVAIGSSIITATYEGKIATMEVTVTAAVDTETPTVPSDLAVNNVTETTITLTWTGSADNIGVKGYKIFRNGVNVASTNKTSYINTGLIPGKSYIYTVKAYDAANNMSEDSNIVTEETVTDIEVPSTPADLVSTATSYTSITLSWSPSTDDIAMKGYEIYRNGKKVASTTKTVYTNTGLVPGVTYTYVIKAYDLAGNYSAESNSIISTTVADTNAPIAPSGLNVVSFTATTATLSWTASNDNVGVRGYDIYRDGTKVGTTSKTTYTNTGLIPGKSYTYIVKAFDISKNVCEGTNSVTVSTVADTEAPTVPLNLIVTTTEVTATLSWTEATDNVSVKGYEIYRDGNKIATTNKSNFINNGLIPGKTYNYTIKAYDLVGNESTLSTAAVAVTVSDNLPPEIPSNLTASDIKETSVTLTWNPSTDNIKLREYQIFRDGVKIRTTTTTSFTNTGLIPGKTYIYTVKSADIAGNVSNDSNSSNVTTLADVDAPTVPGDLSGVSTEVSVALTWTPSTDNTVLKGYNIYRDGKKIASTSKTSYTNIGLIPGKNYKYTVNAYDIVSNVSSDSEAINVTTVNHTVAPTNPTLLTGTATETSVLLSWGASIDTVAIKEYQIFRDGVKIAATNKTSYTNTNLIPGITYSYTVKARDIADIVSEDSNIFSIDTVTDVQSPTAPSNLTTSMVNATSATLTWTLSTDNVKLKGYEIYRDGVKIATTSGTSYTVSKLISGKTYKFTVKAYDLVNNLSEDSNPINVTPQ